MPRMPYCRSCWTALWKPYLMTAADYYKNRELTSAAAVYEIPTGAKAIIDKKRVWFGGKQ